nr:Sir2 silent information regulator family NAD-dependent deacetylase [Bariatricus massiliensis]
MTSAESYPIQIARLKTEIETADAIVIGAGAGMSVSAGLTYNGERFKKYFSDFHDKYGISDMYAGGFYPYDTLEEYWAWWSRHILVNRYEVSAGKPYSDLFSLVKDKEYFVLTTNVDHQFQLAGFDKTRLFYTQGDYGLWQCSEACHDKTYDNKEMVYRMASEQRDMKIPAELVPKCPVCGRPMTMNLRCDDTFVQDEGWYAAAARYDDFIRRCEERHVLFMELGVGGNTPGIIKYPFWKMTAKNPQAVFACVNYGEAVCPKEIACRSVCINGDIGKVIDDLL